VNSIWLMSAKGLSAEKKSTPLSRSRKTGSKGDIRILVANDHRIFREGLLRMLREEEGMAVLAEAEDGKSLLQMVKEMHPDVVIMEPGLPGAGGTETAKEILAQSPGTRIIALSMCSDRASVLGMIRAGSSGYLIKDSSFKELVRAVRAVASGHSYMSPGIMGFVVKEYVSRIDRSPASGASILTDRETEVLRLIADGRRTKEIASSLGVSSKTIESHRRQIMEKLDLSSVAALVKYAIREGLASL